MTLGRGRLPAYFGLSGVGKSSLLRLVAGLGPALEHGTIEAGDGRPLEGRIAYMDQRELLLPWLSVPGQRRPRGPGCEAIRWIETVPKGLLRAVGLSGRETDLPAVLSGGMRQRTALARTLMEDRPIVLMDEPFSALDALTRLHLQDLAGRLPRRPYRVARDPRPYRSGSPWSPHPRHGGHSGADRPGDSPLRRPTARSHARGIHGSLPRVDGAPGPIRARLGTSTMTWLIPRLLHALVTVCGLGLLWQVVVWVTQAPPYILPGPLPVLQVIAQRTGFLAAHAGVTVAEILLGLILGTLLGGAQRHPHPPVAPGPALAAPDLGDLPGHTCVCHRARSRAVARLWHGVQGGDGYTHHLLPGDG